MNGGETIIIALIIFYLGMGVGIWLEKTMKKVDAEKEVESKNKDHE